MKKQMKKLVLMKETVRSLTQVESRRVMGGTTGYCGTGYCPAESGVCSVQCWSNPDYSCQQDFDPLGTSAC
jgi:hypothetical protein